MLRKTLVPLLSVTALALPAASAAAAPVATAAKDCGYSRSLGFTYVTSINAHRVGCKKAKKVIKAYHDAGAGKRKVKGFNCSRKVLLKSPTQYDAKGTCKDGRKKIVFGFTENT